MPKPTFALLFLAAFAVLAGCATLSEEECRTVDFEQLGVQDGAAGYKKDRINNHTKACSEHGLSTDPAAYLKGWRQGIVTYCTPQKGYDTGIAGRTYRGACPDEIADGFLAAYGPAINVHNAEEELAALEEQVAEKQERLLVLLASEDEADRERAKDLRRDIAWERAEVSRARRKVRDARDRLLLYLAANPEVRP